MNLQELRNQYRDFILAKASECGLTNVRVFGSVARNEAHEGSDLDLLVDTQGRVGLFALVGFQNSIGDVIGMPVQAVTSSAISPYFRDKVLLQAVPL